MRERSVLGDITRNSRCGELDRERQPFEQLNPRIDGRPIRRRAQEAALGRLRPLPRQRRSVGGLQRREGEGLLSRESQHLARGHTNPPRLPG